MVIRNEEAQARAIELLNKAWQMIETKEEQGADEAEDLISEANKALNESGYYLFWWNDHDENDQDFYLEIPEIRKTHPAGIARELNHSAKCHNGNPYKKGKNEDMEYWLRQLNFISPGHSLEYAEDGSIELVVPTREHPECHECGYYHGPGPCQEVI